MEPRDREKGKKMIYTSATATVPVSLLEEPTEYEYMVCVFCDTEVSHEIPVCPSCGEYKGVMTVEAWEDYTGESWM